MTRYTKLDKRRAEFDKSKPGPTALSSPEPEEESASPATAAAAEAAGPSEETEAEQDINKAVPAEGPSEEPPKRDATQLLKRAKLIRLKAKKAKTEDKRRMLLRQCKDLERQASEANGEQGRNGSGKGKDGKNDAAGNAPPRPVLNAQGKVETNPWKVMEAERRRDNEDKSAHRREKRAEERLANQRCYACRGMGHSAKDCQASTFGEGEDDAAKADVESQAQQKTQPGSKTKECCYRCGSTEHNLSKCRRAAPKVGPQLPFASCFVCQGKGHIASQCPQNAGKGIYPNGGSCKLCQSVEHLARDCDLNKKSTSDFSNAAVGMGMGMSFSDREGGSKRKRAPGADEDDFHALSRARIDVQSTAPSSQAKAPSKFAAKTQKKVISF